MSSHAPSFPEECFFTDSGISIYRLILCSNPLDDVGLCMASPDVPWDTAPRYYSNIVIVHTYLYTAPRYYSNIVIVHTYLCTAPRYYSNIVIVHTYLCTAPRYYSNIVIVQPACLAETPLSTRTAGQPWTSTGRRHRTSLFLFVLREGCSKHVFPTQYQAPSISKHIFL